MKLLDRILCRLGRCRACRWLNTEDGLGGRCVNCGLVHGWMTKYTIARRCKGQLSVTSSCSMPVQSRQTVQPGSEIG